MSERSAPVGVMPPATSEPLIASSRDYLAVVLDWLRALLAWQIEVTRATYGPLADDGYRGLYIPASEADLLAAQPVDLPPELVSQRADLAEARFRIEHQAEQLERTGVDVPLRRLARSFALGPLERDVLLLALAPELDLRYERIYAFIQDDITRRRPAVDLALRLLARSPAERLAALDAFEPDSPLLANQLIQLFEDGQRRPPLPARFIKLDDRITAELRRLDSAPVALDAAITAVTSLSVPRRRLDDLVLPAGLAVRLHANAGPGMVLALQGGYGSGRTAIAEALAAAAGEALLTVECDRLPDPDAPGALPPAETIRRVLREARLRGATLLWRGVDRVLHDEGPAAWRVALLGALDTHPGRSVLAIERPWEARGLLHHYLRVELPALSYGEREIIWRQQLNGATPDDATLQVLASTFRLSGGQIRDAARMAATLARWHQHEHATPSARELFAACRAQSSGRLTALAHKIRTTYTWDDIVLPADQVSQLREICMQVRHRRTVLERWGFDRHLAMGKGVNVLFAGPSGTGKTMAAEIVAADLGLDLYKIDLSSMVSKYIGETEKNLDAVFTAAREANAILFFDEADALFGKRSEVKDAHDRYANIEVGYLLQKMEEYDGVVVLATNLRKNLDEAFVRRLHMAIDFPFPEEEDRLRIWRKVFPTEAPLASDVDLGFVARQFKLAGGNIRNVALLAAFLAAEDGESLGMPQIVRAVRREYQKIGRLVTAAEFGPYLAMVRP